MIEDVPQILDLFRKLVPIANLNSVVHSGGEVNLNEKQMPGTLDRDSALDACTDLTEREQRLVVIKASEASKAPLLGMREGNKKDRQKNRLEMPLALAYLAERTHRT